MPRLGFNVCCVPQEERARHLVEQYAEYPEEELKDCVLKISKKLGGDRTLEALESIEKGDFYSTAMITLKYYDKAYMFSLEKNHEEHTVVTSSEVDAERNAQLILKHVDTTKAKR